MLCRNKFIFFCFLFICICTVPARALEPESNPYLPEARKIAEEALKKMKKSPHYREALHKVRESTPISPDKKAKEVVQKTLNVKKGEKTLSIKKEKLYLVISSSIPENTLRTYMAQIEKLASKGIFVQPVLIGFVNGMKQIKPTIEFYLRIVSKDPSSEISKENLRPVSIEVDPLKANKASSVPALMNADGNCIVYGDAPLEFLIKKIHLKECGKKFGTTFDFAEKNALNEIKEAATKNFPSPETIKQFFTRRIKEITELPVSLPPVRRTTTKIIEPSYTLSFDIKDPKTGEILYPRGFTFNPLEYIPDAPFQVLLINGKRPIEVAFAKELLKKQPYIHIRILGGNAACLSEEFKQPVLSGFPYLKKGWCSATPCLIKRKGKYLQITEFATEDIQKEVSLR